MASVRNGTTIYVGPLRIYVNWNHQGSCDTFVFCGAATVGHSYNVEEAVILKLIDEAQHIEYEPPVDGEVVQEPQGNQGGGEQGSRVTSSGRKLRSPLAMLSA